MAKYLDDAALGITTHAQCHVQSDGTRRNHIDVLNLVLAHLHDGALSKTLFYFLHCRLQCLHLLLFRRQIRIFFLFLCHKY